MLVAVVCLASLASPILALYDGGHSWSDVKPITQSAELEEAILGAPGAAVVRLHRMRPECPPRPAWHVMPLALRRSTPPACVEGAQAHLDAQTAPTSGVVVPARTRHAPWPRVPSGSLPQALACPRASALRRCSFTCQPPQPPKPLRQSTSGSPSRLLASPPWPRWTARRRAWPACVRRPRGLGPR